jgi:hypothetical protein
LLAALCIPRACRERRLRRWPTERQVTHVLAMSPDLDLLIGSEVIEEGYFED